MLERNFVPGGPSRMQMKDLNTALAAAGEASLALPITSKLGELFQALLDAGGNEFDHSALLLALERQSPGVRLGDGPDQLP